MLVTHLNILFLAVPPNPHADAATRMMIGPRNLTNDSGWQRSPVFHAVRIIVCSLFSKVKVSDEVFAGFKCNPFSGPHNLHQQMLKSLCTGMHGLERAVIWRTQPSSQLKHKSAMTLAMPSSDMSFTESDLSSRSHLEVSNIEEVRPTQKDVFIRVLKCKAPNKPHRPQWQQKVDHLGLTQSEDSCPSSSTAFNLLHAKCLLFNEARHGKAIPTMEAMNTLTHQLHFKLYPTKKQRVEFQKKHRKIKKWPHEDEFRGDLAACPDSTCVFDVPPKDLKHKNLLVLQQAESEHLSQQLEENSFDISTVLAPSDGSFPLFIASRYGIWGAGFLKLVEDIHALHCEIIEACQQDDAVAEVQGHLVVRQAAFLGVFALESFASSGHAGLRRPP
jgi:hypothetical protein